MRNLILTIFILLTLTVATAYLTRDTAQTGGGQNNPAENIQTTAIKPKAVINFTPADVNITYVQTASVSVNVIYQGEKPDFAQFEMGFDPEIIGDISVDPGNFFSSPVILLNSIDEINGRISYAIKSTGNQDAPDYNSEIINIKFRMINRNADYTNIYFLPKTKMSAGNEDIALDVPNGLNIYIENTTSPIIPSPSI